MHPDPGPSEPPARVPRVFCADEATSELRVQAGFVWNTLSPSSQVQRSTCPGEAGCAVDKHWLCFLVSRLEERESEMKKEYNALHQRHTEVGVPATGPGPRGSGKAPHVGLAADLGCLFIPWGSPAEPESPGPHVARLPSLNSAFISVRAQWG